jgi:hypothetical protein
MFSRPLDRVNLACSRARRTDARERTLAGDFSDFVDTAAVSAIYKF